MKSRENEKKKKKIQENEESGKWGGGEIACPFPATVLFRVNNEIKKRVITLTL